MNLKELSDQDFLYVKNSPMRTLILQRLSEQKDYVRIREIAASLEKDAGTVSFHCRGLEQHGLVRTEVVVRKALVKITEKGMMVVNKMAEP